MKVLLSTLVTAFLLPLAYPMVIAGFHVPQLPWLAWVILIPWLYAIQGTSFWRAMGLTFFMAFIANGVICYWMYIAMTEFGGVAPSVASSGVLVVGLLHGLFLTPFVAIAWFLCRRFHINSLIAYPVLWTLWEWVHTYIPFGGFPWTNLAYSQGPYLRVMQVGDIFGVYGLCFIIVLFNVAGVELVRTSIEKRPLPWKPALVALAVVAAMTGYGSIRLQQVDDRMAEAPSLKVALIQPNIAQELKWQREQMNEQVRILSALTDEAVSKGAEFVIWPESAYTDLLPVHLEELMELDQWEVPVLMGTVTIRPTQFRPVRRERAVYNSAMQISKGGRVSGLYHKTHLVPVGEYDPLKGRLGVIAKTMEGLVEFSAAEPAEPLSLNGTAYGVTICYEDLFPDIARHFVHEGAHFITNITNDAWYKESSASWQHLVFSQWRAVETRRSVVRSTNTGVTAAIAPTGALMASLPWFNRANLVQDIPLMEETTFYVRFGDLPLMILMLGMLAINLIVVNIRRW